MKITLIAFIILSTANAFSQLTKCIYGKTNSCPDNFYCTKLDKNKDACLSYPDVVPTVIFPFESDQEITCYKSEVLNKVTTHAYNPSRFAADLYSKHGINASIISVFDGTVYVNNNCQPFNNECGSGYGNSVKVIGKNGYMAFYAHLSKVLVKNGQKVKQGQKIGIEGATGSVGKEPITSINGFKHLHFSIHKYEEWGKKYDKESHPAFRSIPYKLKLKINGVSQIRDVRKLPCDYFSEATPLQGL